MKEVNWLVVALTVCVMVSIIFFVLVPLQVNKWNTRAREVINNANITNGDFIKAEAIFPDGVVSVVFGKVIQIKGMDGSPEIYGIWANSISDFLGWKRREYNWGMDNFPLCRFSRISKIERVNKQEIEDIKHTMSI